MTSMPTPWPTSRISRTRRLAVEQLARGRTLLGNTPAVLAPRARPACARARAAVARAHTPAVRASAPPSERTGWLLKPRRSGGGHGIVRWEHGMPVPRTLIVQQRLTGARAPSSSPPMARALRRSRSRDSSPAIRRSAPPATPTAAASSSRIAPSCSRTHVELAARVTREFELRGVCGIDFIARGDVPYAIEVNPRPTASMELVERATGISIWLAHVGGSTGAIPPSLLAATGASMLVHGKAVLYARRPVVLGETTHWLRTMTCATFPLRASALRAAVRFALSSRVGAPLRSATPPSCGSRGYGLRRSRGVCVARAREGVRTSR